MYMENARILTVGDSSILVEFEQVISPEINARITTLVRLIKEQQFEGIVDMIPSYCALLITYDPRVMSYGTIKERVEKLLELDIEAKEEGTIKVYEIPVCYDGEFGPDLDNIAKLAGMSKEEVIALHSASDYLIYMMGFMPGFPYLGGLDERIHTPRLDNPRLKIAEGSVGIGGASTGIYPLESPGGWQLMGRTPVKTYDPSREEPILLESGNYIRFVPISEAEYEEILAQVAAGTYEFVVRGREV